MRRYEDFEGDVWEEQEDGSYVCPLARTMCSSLADLEDEYGPLRRLDLTEESITVRLVLADAMEEFVRMLRRCKGGDDVTDD